MLFTNNISHFKLKNKTHFFYPQSIKDHQCVAAFIAIWIFHLVSLQKDMFELRDLTFSILLSQRVAAGAKSDVQYINIINSEPCVHVLSRGSMWTDTSLYLWLTPRGCGCVFWEDVVEQMSMSSGPQNRFTYSGQMRFIKKFSLIVRFVFYVALKKKNNFKLPRYINCHIFFVIPELTPFISP